MLDISLIDKKNTYIPNLEDSKEAALRTFNSASYYLKMASREIEELLNSDVSETDIYDSVNVIATILALSCELFLKSIYIVEKKDSISNVDDIWNSLKSSSFKLDKNGNPIYLLKTNKREVYTYLKVDDKGNSVVSNDGKNIYVDEDGNEYKDGFQGKKIRLSGHQLDRLIEILNDDTRLLLELRVTTIPMNNTNVFDKVSVYDFLKINNIIFDSAYMSKNQYNGWIDKHKKTFEKNRYSGEKTSDVNLEFLFHLANQIQVVADYKLNNNINPLDNIDIFKVDKDINECQLLLNIQNDFLYDLSVLIKNDINENDEYRLIADEKEFFPDEIYYLSQYISMKYMSNNLINECKTNDDFKEKLDYLISKNCTGLFFNEISVDTLYKLVKYFDMEDIIYLNRLLNAFLSSYSDSFIKENNYYADYNFKQIILSFSVLNLSLDDIINYALNFKIKYNCKINNIIFRDFISFMELNKFYLDLVDKDILNSADSFSLN